MHSIHMAGTFVLNTTFSGFCLMGGFLHAPIVIFDHKLMHHGDDFGGFYENETQVQLSQCAGSPY